MLNGPRDIHDAFARDGLRNTLVERLLGHIHQLLRQHAAAAHRHRPGSIANKPVINNTDIETDDIAKIQHPRPGQAMNNLLVHRDADMARKPR